MSPKFLHTILFFLFLIGGNNVIAQGNLQYDDGIVAKEVDHSEIEGTPYLTENWTTGVVKLANGNTYNDVFLKYNMVSDVLYFQTEKKDMLTFVKPVSEFTLAYTADNEELVKHYKNGFTDIPGYTAQNFFEVLVEGKAQLIKKEHKFVQSESGMALGTTSQKYAVTAKYYLIVDGKATPVKRDKKSVLSLFDDKQDEIAAYIKSSRLDMKNDVDLAKVIIYYNSI